MEVVARPPEEDLGQLSASKDLDDGTPEVVLGLCHERIRLPGLQFVSDRL
jgi:hypothetical protein